MLLVTVLTFDAGSSKTRNLNGSRLNLSNKVVVNCHSLEIPSLQKNRYYDWMHLAV